MSLFLTLAFPFETSRVASSFKRINAMMRVASVQSRDISIRAPQWVYSMFVVRLAILSIFPIGTIMCLWY